MAVRPTASLLPASLVALALATMFALAVTRVARGPTPPSSPPPSPDEIRALALARGGLEVALARLRSLATREHCSWRTGGIGSTSPDQPDAPRPSHRWAYSARIGRSQEDFVEVSGAGISLSRASYPPSFTPGRGVQIFAAPSFYRGNTGVIATDDSALAAYPPTEIAEYQSHSPAIARAGRGRPVSGWLGDSWRPQDGKRVTSDTYEERGDNYVLKVLDLASMVHVNVDGAMTASFLDDLGDEVDAHFRWRTERDGSVVAWVPAELAQMGYRYPGLAVVGRVRLGQWLLARRAARPGRVFSTKEQIHDELRTLFGAGYVRVEGQDRPAAEVADEDYEKLKDFITCHGYRDRTVIEPGTLMTNQLYAAADPARPEREARAPINVNTASPPVLAAWLRGIAYHRYDEDALARGDATSVLVRLEDKVGVAGLRQLAYRLHRVASYTPLSYWTELRALLLTREWGRFPRFPAVMPATETYGLQGTHVGDTTANTPLEHAFGAAVDAAGLDVYDCDAIQAMADPNTMLNKANPDDPMRRLVDKYDLAEWSTELCFHAMGYYEVECRGLITRDGGRLVAQQALVGIYQVYDQICVTTQRDFELGRLAVGRDMMTNEDVPLHGPSGATVTSLPEPRGEHFAYAERGSGTDPYASADPRRYGRVALYDGSLCANTVERRVSTATELALGFAPRAAGGALDADDPPSAGPRRGFAEVDRVRDVDPTTGELLPIARSGPPAAIGLGGRVALERFLTGSDVLPLGLYADRLRRRALGVHVAGVAGAEGAIELWVKPRFARALDRELWVCWQDELGRAIRVFREGTHVIAQFDLGEASRGRLAFDTDYAPPGPWRAGTWHHVHVDWDQHGRLFVDGASAELGGVPPHDDAGLRAGMAVPYMPFGRARYAGGETLWVGGEPVPEGSVPDFANATIDRVRVLAAPAYPRDSPGQVPGQDLDFRYNPPTARPAQPLYWQDLTAHLSGYGCDLQLGTVRGTDLRDGLCFVRFYLQVNELDAAEIVAG